MEAHGQAGEAKGKYEAEIRELQQKVKDQAESLLELENAQKDEEQKFAVASQEWTSREQSLLKEVQRLKEAKEELTEQLKSLRAKFDVEIDQRNRQTASESAQNSERIQELEEVIRELEEQNESLKSQTVKDQAVAKQKQEFIQLQLEQEQKQKEEMKLNHERILKSFQNSQRESVIGKEEAKNQIAELSQAHQDEVQQLSDTYMQQIQERESAISGLTENLSKVQLELTLFTEDSKKEIEALRESLATAEEDRDTLGTTGKKQLAQQQKDYEDTIERLNEQLRERDELLEEKEREQQDAINEIDSNSQAKLAELKKFYDAEKQRFDQRLTEQRENGQKRLTETEIEYKNQLLYQQEQSDEMQEGLELELSQLNDQFQSQMNANQKTIALMKQQLEANEKQLAEKVEALERLQEAHAQKLDQQYALHDQERRHLTDKAESTAAKITQLERAKITLENQIDSLKLQIASKDKLANETKEEAEAERAETGAKYADLKRRFEEKEDDLNQKNIDFEKEQALMKQQISFSDKKLEEMQTQYDRTVARYEDRIKMDKEEMQREVKDRSARLQEEKEAAEAKYQAKRAELKDVQKRLITKTTQAETERAVLIQKHKNLEDEREKLIGNYEAEIQNLQEQNMALTRQHEDAQLSNASSYEQLRREHDMMATELQEQKALLDKEKALWEGRYQFLESQRDQAKGDLDDLQKKFQQSLELQQKMHFDNKSSAELSHQQMVT